MVTLVWLRIEKIKRKLQNADVSGPAAGSAATLYFLPKIDTVKKLGRGAGACTGRGASTAAKARESYCKGKILKHPGGKSGEIIRGNQGKM